MLAMNKYYREASGQMAFPGRIPDSGPGLLDTPDICSVSNFLFPSPALYSNDGRQYSTDRNNNYNYYSL